MGFINARAERIDTAPAFRRPFHKRRCLIPADGFYEWKRNPEGKFPYSIDMKDGSTFVSLDSGMVGKIPIPKSGCGPASSSLVKQTSWSPKYIPGCLSFCRRRPTGNGFREGPGKKSSDRLLPKK
jgi:SOS response associated peptidase (SRAP)